MACRMPLRSKNAAEHGSSRCCYAVGRGCKAYTAVGHPLGRANLRLDGEAGKAEAVCDASGLLNIAGDAAARDAQSVTLQEFLRLEFVPPPVDVPASLTVARASFDQTVAPSATGGLAGDNLNL